MRTLGFVAGALFAAAAATASAQTYYGPAYSYSYDPYAARTECINTHNGMFERVRPGEAQDDLDFSRCRTIGGRYYRPYRYAYARDECWNPGAGHFERVRPGEIQNDLDFSRCRAIRDDRLAYDQYYWYR